MLNKFLLIGVGGSGGKTLRYAWREITFRLDTAGWKGGMPAAFQLLHIDVPENPDVIEKDVPGDVAGAIRYLGLAEYPNSFGHYVDQALKRPLEPLAGWRPDPPAHPEIDQPWLGAGQRRVVGNIIAISEMRRIGEAIENAVAAMMEPAASKELTLLNRTLGSKEGGTPQPTVVIVSSLAGGSGSGMFLRITELLKSLAAGGREWLDSGLMTILFSADAFPDVKARARAGLEPNCLAAMSELLNASEHTGALTPAELALIEPAGGAPIEGRRSGRTALIVGGGTAGDKAVSFTTSLEVNRAVAKALSMFMLNDAVQAPFFTYGVNPPAEPMEESFSLTDPSKPAAGCSALGYASVSTGRKLFAEYAQERLAAQALRRLLYGHRETLDDSELARDQVLIDRIADDPAIRDVFFDKTGLHEIGPHDQVIDRLRDPKVKKARLDALPGSVRSALPTGKKVKGIRMKDSATSMFNAAAEKFEQQEEAERKAAASEWIPEVRERLIAATQDSVGTYGLPVSIRLIELLEKQMLDAASGLESAHAQFHREESRSLESAPALFAGAVNKAVDAGSDLVDKFLEHRRTAISRRTEAALYDYAAKLLRDAARGLVPPLRRSLEGARAALVKAEEDKVSADMVDRWSTGEVAPHLRPAPTELLLEDIATFPNKLGQLFGVKYPELGEHGGERRAVAEVIMQGLPLKDAEGKVDPEAPGKLIHETSLWGTEVDPNRPLNVPVANADYTFTLTSAMSVFMAAERWTKDPKGVLAGYVKESLAEWLDAAKHDDYVRRERNLEATLGQALKLAQPLVSVNTKTYNAVHTHSAPSVKMIISTIPLKKDADVYLDVLKAVASVDAAGDRPEELFDATSKTQSVEITTFFESAMHPVVMSSLVGPIQRDWQSRTTGAEREQFWTLRRARPLPTFAPVSQARLDALVRGWLTARVLGQLAGNMDGLWCDGALRVWVPGGKSGWRSLPRYLLGKEPPSCEFALPALVETLALSMAEFGSGRPESLEAYMRLIDLGVPVAGEGTLALHRDLSSWLKDGRVGSKGAPDPSPPFGDAGDSEEDRRAAVREWVDAYRERVAKAANMPLDQSATLTVPRGWEIRDNIARATGALIKALDEMSDDIRVLG